MQRFSWRRSLTSLPVAARAVSPANRRFPASRNSSGRLYYRRSAIPLRLHGSVMLYSPGRLSSTIVIFSSAEYCWRIARRTSFTACSNGILLVADFSLISASPKLTMNQKPSVPQATYVTVSKPEFVGEWMVADAVCDEPVSGPFSLVTGKIQGIFGNFRPIAAKCARFQANYQWLGSKFPDSDNRVFESA